LKEREEENGTMLGTDIVEEESSLEDLDSENDGNTSGEE
jgi:hypothetical protein